MKMQKIHWKNFILPSLSVVVIILLCGINIRKLDYIVVLNDEFGYWANAAAIAGYDWKELIAETPYYAGGYSLWLVPIILLFSNSEIWYKAAIGLNILLLLGAYFLSFNITRKLFPEVNKNLVYIISLIVIIYPSNIIYAQVTWSETLLYFLMWLSTYFLIRMEENFSYIKACGFALILIYMYMVHARTIGIVFVGTASLFFIFLIKKKPLYFFVVPIFILGVGYMVNAGIKEYQLSELWCNSSTSNINNVSVNSGTVSAYANKIFQNGGLFIESLGGKLIYLLIGSGLTFPIVIVRFWEDLMTIIKEKQINIPFFLTRFWCLFSLLVSWVLCSMQMLSWNERKDMIVYARYMENTLGPVLLLGIVYSIYTLKETRRGILMSALCLLLGLRSVYWRVLEAPGVFNSICSPVIGAFYDFFEENTLNAFIGISIMCLIFLVLLLVESIVKSERGRAGIIGGTFLILFCIIGINGDIYVNDVRAGLDRSIPLLKEKIENEYKAKEICYVKNEDIDPYSVRPKYLQFVIPDNSINLIEQKELNTYEDSLILANQADDETLKVLEKRKDIKLILATPLADLYYCD